MRILPKYCHLIRSLNLRLSLKAWLLVKSMSSPYPLWVGILATLNRSVSRRQWLHTHVSASSSIQFVYTFVKGLIWFTIENLQNRTRNNKGPTVLTKPGKSWKMDCQFEMTMGLVFVQRLDAGIRQKLTKKSANVTLLLSIYFSPIIHHQIWLCVHTLTYSWIFIRFITLCFAQNHWVHRTWLLVMLVLRRFHCHGIYQLKSTPQ